MFRARLRTIALGVAACAAAAAPPAAADDGPVPTTASPSADEWLRVGLERYERGNLVGAIEAFERGHQREPRPVFLFALGQAHRKRGDCDRARALFDAFLATSPTEAQAAAAMEQRERCAPPAPAPAPTAAAVTVTPATAPPPAPRSRAWWTDPVALGATGATAALVGGGVALWLSANAAAADAATATTYDRHRALRERAESRQLYAGVALGAGAVAGAVAVWRIVRDRSERPRPQAAWQPVIAPDAVGLAYGGRW